MPVTGSQCLSGGTHLSEGGGRHPPRPVSCPPAGPCPSGRAGLLPESCPAVLPIGMAPPAPPRPFSGCLCFPCSPGGLWCLGSGEGLCGLSPQWCAPPLPRQERTSGVTACSEPRAGGRGSPAEAVALSTWDRAWGAGLSLVLMFFRAPPWAGESCSPCRCPCRPRIQAPAGERAGVGQGQGLQPCPPWSHSQASGAMMAPSLRLQLPAPPSPAWGRMAREPFTENSATL